MIWVYYSKTTIVYGHLPVPYTHITQISGNKSIWNLIIESDFCKLSSQLFIVACSTGYYGIECSENCNINCNVTTECDMFTGECAGGCKPGWTGMICNDS